MKGHAWLWLMTAAAVFFVAGARAAEMSKAKVVRDYSDVVMPAEQQAYEAGVKAYNQCLREHGFKYQWTAWTHETGNTYVYSYVTDPVAWSDFDTMHATGGVCDAVWRSQVDPHLKSETSAFMVAMPKLTHMPEGMDLGQGLIDVTYYKVKSGYEWHEKFTNAIEMITAAASKSNWPGHYSFASVQDAGEDAPDYILVWAAKDWEDFGKDIDPPLWKMVENAYGKKKTEELRKTLGEVIVNASSHVDHYSADLTYTPSGE